MSDTGAEHVDVTIDVTDAAGLGEPAWIVATVHLPTERSLRNRQVVAFAKPGGGFSRHYYTTDLPGPASGSEAAWHAERGWVFVSVDHLGVGESSTHHDPTRLTFRTVAAANAAAERKILDQLCSGTLLDGVPPLDDPVRIGIGQSMGGALTVVQQARHHCYDGIAVLGFSAVHTHVAAPPGQPPIVAAWRPRDIAPGEDDVVLNAPRFLARYRETMGAEPTPRSVQAPYLPSATQWSFYYEDVLEHLPPPGAPPPRWVSATVPGLVNSVLTPGVIASEAAAVDVPVLAAMGERDVVVDPRSEPRGYLSAPSIDLFVCPRMAHMHNFAGTRALFWERIQTWGTWVSAMTEATRRHPSGGRQTRQPSRRPSSTGQ